MINTSVHKYKMIWFSYLSGIANLISSFGVNSEKYFGWRYYHFYLEVIHNYWPIISKNSNVKSFRVIYSEISPPPLFTPASLYIFIKSLWFACFKKTLEQVFSLKRDYASNEWVSLKLFYSLRWSHSHYTI